QLKKEPDGQRSLTDPDARSMNSQAKGSGLVGYNVQAAVDARHHLIVAHEVTTAGHDRAQLSKMAMAAREAMGKTKLQALADRGYFNGTELKACEEAGITTYVPKPMTSNAKAEGRFDKSDFIYFAKADEYQCPAGERAIYRFTTFEKNGNKLRVYWTSACPTCPLKGQCTTGDYRRIRRWEHEEVLERVQQRLDRKPVAMTLRRCTVEHVFGTLKYWMGSTHFLTKTLSHVSTEMSLHVLAYNMKRVIAVLGITRTMKAMRLMGA
ncbi:transposase, partial [Variovorax sp. MHTC-1]|uniref:transposase n=1 Tax=Variovorax sp. MHTC-1 TaxID=2495593 RepID=UPI000F988EF9